MSAPIETRIIRRNAKPMLVVLPYQQYRQLVEEAGDDGPAIPQDVEPIRARRE